MSTPGLCRSTSRDSLTITSTSRGSFCTSFDSATARSLGLIAARSTYLPSAFETIFWARTSTSPSRKAGPWLWVMLQIKERRSVPGSMRGIPGTEMSCKSRVFAALRMRCSTVGGRDHCRDRDSRQDVLRGRCDAAKLKSPAVADRGPLVFYLNRPIEPAALSRPAAFHLYGDELGVSDADG